MTDHDFARVDITVEYAITKDHHSGDPWPPPGDGWRHVAFLDDWRSKWRRIFLNIEHQGTP